MKKQKVNDLRQWISFERQTVTPDGLGGGDVTGVETVVSTWAAIWPVKAGEVIENMRTNMKVSHRIRIRFRPGIDEKMTIRHGERSFEILGFVNPEERNIWLDMVCNEL